MKGNMESKHLNGIINVLKPPGMTSHDVVSFIRRIAKTKKAGHTGTLDPGAAGVLPVCLGNATRVIEYMSDDIKRYRAEMTLGKTTDTQDGFGRTVEVFDASCISKNQVEKVLIGFIGIQAQVPPMVSAIKHKGRKLYELAREGVEIERKARDIHIYSIKIIKFSGFGSPNPEVLFDIECSRGTYVRTICHDAGAELGCGGYMSFLVRTSANGFSIFEALTLEDIKCLGEQDKWSEVLLPLEKAVFFPEVWIHEGAVQSVKHGNKVYFPGIKSIPEKLVVEQKVKIICENEGFIAVGKIILEDNSFDNQRYTVQPVKVFS
jgi:tRNA pseudouridine55 synthase